ncbi:hypothetical protein EDO6_05545 [Paenibacillus xylanexedens]|nr:hypothetical protein EDO6_05545 [Paenibacillus xylanexedens]
MNGKSLLRCFKERQKDWKMVGKSGNQIPAFGGLFGES